MKATNNSIINAIDANFEKSCQLNDFFALYYHEKSKYDKYSFLQERNRIAFFALPQMVKREVMPYKCYPNAELTPLNGYIGNEPPVDIYGLIRNRRSSRKFVPYTMSLNELAKILYYGYGITGMGPLKGLEGNWYYRSVPSGGGLYPLEIYVYVNHGAIRRGIYHYRPDKNALEYVRDEELSAFSKSMAVGNIDIENATCIVFISSMFLRNMLKYGERGYRFILQEVGEVGQNISLISDSVGMSSCIIGGFQDDEINGLLGVNTPAETVQSIIVIGHK